jgi:hypothetical protein
MLNNLKLSTLLLITTVILACTLPPKDKTVKKPAVNQTLPVSNSSADDMASFISGMQSKNSNCLAKLDSSAKWIHYAADLDSLFVHGKSFRFDKMKVWADSELVKNKEIKTVFYPFSGPDFLNANIFYPDVDQYIMIAMEPIGFIPDLCSMPVDSVFSYLNTINNSLKDIFKRSYFITKRMDTDLRKTKVNGTIPLIALFIKRTGHQIVSMEKIAVDSLGKCQPLEDLKVKKNFVQGIKIDINSPTDPNVKSIYYFRTDISNKGLSKNKGFKVYMSNLPQSFTYLKAASYLMHGDDFKEIRNVIFDISFTILQDDSGISYRSFDKNKWNIQLYGKYQKPGTEFSYIKEPELEKAFKNSVIKPLPYTIGYNWGTGYVNLLYARRK